VLFWAELLGVLLVAAGLARTDLAPLRWRDWALLAVGLTQLPIAAAAAIAGWLLALGVRRRYAARIPGSVRFDLVQLALVVWTLVALGILVGALHQGLLGHPEMQIAGNGSSAGELRWYHDRSDGPLPQPWLLSVPLWVYRVVMLAWALWLAAALLRWLRWGLESLVAGGGWRPLRRAKSRSAAAGAPPAGAPPAVT
jgi:hypothetical protein